MAKLPEGLKLTQEEVAQTIDLKKWTGKDLSSDPTLVREIGQSMIDYMLKRADDNKGINNEPLIPNKYSKEYAESLEFIAAGKSRNDVNMKLSGDMLGSIDLDDQGNIIKIKVGEEQSAKAYGHMTGFKGHPTIPQGKYKRQFFGISKEEFDQQIMPKFKDELPKKSRQDLQAELISRIRSGGDLFNTSDTLDTALFKDLMKIIEEMK